MAVRGVVCSGAEVLEGDIPYAFGSMTFPALALDPPIQQNGLLQPTHLYDLAADGLLPVVDLDLIEFDKSDPEHTRIRIRPSVGT